MVYRKPRRRAALHRLLIGLVSLLLVVLAALPPVVLTLHIARQDCQSQTAALKQRSQELVKLADQEPYKYKEYLEVVFLPIIVGG